MQTSGETAYLRILLTVRVVCHVDLDVRKNFLSKNPFSSREKALSPRYPATIRRSKIVPDRANMSEGKRKYFLSIHCPRILKIRQSSKSRISDQNAHCRIGPILANFWTCLVLVILSIKTRNHRNWCRDDSILPATIQYGVHDFLQVEVHSQIVLWTISK